MTRPPWEVADIIRRAGNRFVERYHGSLTWAQLKVLRAIERCRTAALGGHRDQCVRCGHQAVCCRRTPRFFKKLDSLAINDKVEHFAA